MERLILDTGVPVAFERGRQIEASMLPDEADTAIAAIMASDLLVGVELAESSVDWLDGPRVDAILNAFDVIAFDIGIARH